MARQCSHAVLPPYPPPGWGLERLKPSEKRSDTLLKIAGLFSYAVESSGSGVTVGESTCAVTTNNTLRVTPIGFGGNPVSITVSATPDDRRSPQTPCASGGEGLVPRPEVAGVASAMIEAEGQAGHSEHLGQS